MIRVSVCLFIIFVVLFSIISPGLAQTQKYSFPQASDGQINEAILKIVPVRWLPSHPLYFLISIKETVYRTFQPSSAKRADFDFVLAGKRLKEAYLLLDKEDIKNSGKSLFRYSSKLEDMNKQLTRARSQNQDVAAIVAEMAEGFKNQEVLLYAISKKAQGSNLDQAINDAGASFVKSVFEINNVVPGVKDRFKTITDMEAVESSLSAVPTPSPMTKIFEQASPSVRPKRIIY